MLNLFELAAKITLDKKDFENDLKDSESMMAKFSNGFNKTLKATAAAAGAIAVAGAAAFGKMAKSALSAVGELEQNIGGSEAVFGEWAEYVQEQAQGAAYAMGLSVNEYLATANKMGSLLQGVGYTEMDSAQLATEAMQRAADVASIMGIDVSSAMESITGAMKGNFTMMDNLGVAINDTSLKAYAASKGWKKAAIDNMTTAEKVGLALEMFMEKTEKYEGNYIKENETLAGSLTTLKAEWQNFLAGNIFGQNDVLAENLGDALGKAADNVVKSLSEIIPRLTKGLSTVMKTVGAKLPELMKALMPGIEMGISALIDLIGEALPYLLQTAANLIPNLVMGLGKVVVKVGQRAPEILKGLWNGFKDAGQKLGGMIFGTDAKGNVKWPTWDEVKDIAQQKWNEIKEKATHMIGALVFGTDEKGEVKWPEWDENDTGLQKAWETIKEGASKLGSAFGKIVFGTDEKGEVKWPTWEDVKEGAKAAWNWIREKAEHLGTEFGKLVFGTDEKGEVKWPTWEEVGEKAGEVWDNIKEEAAKLTGLVFGDGSGITDFTTKLGDIKTAWDNLASDIKNNTIDFLAGFTGKTPEEAAATLERIKEALVGITEFFAGFKLTGLFGQIGSGKLALMVTRFGDKVVELGTKFDWVLVVASGIEAIRNFYREITEEHSILGKNIDWLFPEDQRLDKNSQSPWQKIKENAESWFQQNGANWEAYTGWIDTAIIQPFKDAWNAVSSWYSETFIPGVSGTWDGIMSGVNSAIESAKKAWEGIVGWFQESIIDPIANKWASFMDSLGLGPDSEFGWSPDDPLWNPDGHNAKGLNYVPYDDYMARLHRGEMILNKSRADEYRNGKNDNGSLVDKIAAAVRAGMQGVNYNFALDGEKVAHNTTDRQNNDQMAWRFAVT